MAWYWEAQYPLDRGAREAGLKREGGRNQGWEDWRTGQALADWAPRKLPFTGRR